MDIKSLEEWLRQSRQAGLSDTQIHEQLKSTGWTDQQVNELFSGDMFRQGQLEAVGATKKDDFDTMAGLAESQAGTGGSLPGVFALMGEAWALFKSRIAKFIAVCLIALIIAAIIIGVVFMIGGVGAVFSLSNLSSGSGGIGPILYFLAIIGIWLAVSLIFSWIQAAMLITIAGDSQTVSSILGRAIKMMVPYWWITILMSFLIGGASMLFGIPGIIFSIWFSFAFYILIAENIRGMQAVLKSKEYVRGYWLAVFGRNLALSILITIPIALITAVLANIKAGMLGMVFDGIVFVLFLPYMHCYSFAIYSHLKTIKGASGAVPQKKAKIMITAIAGWLIVPLFFITIGATILSGTRSNSTDTTRKSDISQIYTAAIRYYDDNNAYPDSTNDLVPEYLASVPTDPKTHESYAYALTSDHSNFSLCVHLEKIDITGTREYCKTSQVTTSNNRYNSNSR